MPLYKYLKHSIIKKPYESIFVTLKKKYEHMNF